MIANANTSSTTNSQRKLVYTVTEKGDKSFWTKIGVAFVNRDGSLSVRLEAVPINGTLQIRDEEPVKRTYPQGSAT